MSLKEDARELLIETNASRSLKKPETSCEPSATLKAKPTLRRGRCANKTVGTKLGEKLKGSPKGDRILGGKGKDRITGLGGKDCLNGQAGNRQGLRGQGEGLGEGRKRRRQADRRQGQGPDSRRLRQ